MTRTACRERCSQGQPDIWEWRPTSAPHLKHAFEPSQSLAHMLNSCWLGPDHWDVSVPAHQSRQLKFALPLIKAKGPVTSTGLNDPPFSRHPNLGSST